MSTFCLTASTSTDKKFKVNIPSTVHKVIVAQQVLLWVTGETVFSLTVKNHCTEFWVQIHRIPFKHKFMLIFYLIIIIYFFLDVPVACDH